MPASFTIVCLMASVLLNAEIPLSVAAIQLASPRHGFSQALLVIENRCSEKKKAF